MGTKLFREARKYAEIGYSVIPVKPDKRPYLSAWKPYQTEKADADQIKKWWSHWPKANIGIITGKISGLTVVDTDSQAGMDALSEY